MKNINFKLWLLGKFKIPMIGFTRPRVVLLDDEQLVIEIKLRRRTKNHLNSMYFGALMVGVDLAAGMHAVYYSEKMNKKISLAFKSVHSEFLKRAEGNVLFKMNEGLKVKNMIETSVLEQRRVNDFLEIQMFVGHEIVAKASMELSVKVI